MSDLSAYDSLLAEVIKAPRLSGSKVKTLTDLALSLVQHDTHLVTAIYKQFKARPSKSTQRISALYVFDAIARAARSAVKASKSRAKEPGTPASLLAKMEGIVDGIVDGMIEDGWKEGRDKLRKVSDIWQKANTFPPTAMERIQSKLTATPPAPVPELEAEGNDLDDGPSYASVPAPTLDDSKVTTPSTTPPPAGALPASIMALLGKQAQAQASASNTSTTSTPPPPVDIAALLANVSKVVQQPTQAPTPPASTPALNQAQLSMLASYSQPAPHQYPQPQAGPSRSRSPPVPPRARDPRERSRSPQRRDPRSPQQRDPRVPQAPPRAVDPRDPRSRVARTDSEQALPNESAFNLDPQRQAQAQAQPMPVAAQHTPNPHHAPAPAPNPAVTPHAVPVTLQTFDFTTFDGTKPDSWVALAQAWTNTTGTEPNQMQLMMFISTGQIMTNSGPMGRGMGVGQF